MTITKAIELLSPMKGVEKFIVQEEATMWQARARRGEGGSWHMKTQNDHAFRCFIATGEKHSDVTSETLADAVWKALEGVGLGNKLKLP